MTPEEVQRENVRRGFWLRMAREKAGLSQSTAAEDLGLSGRSKSTLSAWEAGTREPSPSKLSAMALLYGVPVDLFMNPAPTAFEQIDQQLDEIARLAAQREQRDWEQAPGRARAGGDAPDAGRRKAS